MSLANKRLSCLNFMNPDTVLYLKCLCIDATSHPITKFLIHEHENCDCSLFLYPTTYKLYKIFLISLILHHSCYPHLYFHEYLQSIPHPLALLDSLDLEHSSLWELFGVGIAIYNNHDQVRNQSYCMFTHQLNFWTLHSFSFDQTTEEGRCF